jgi:hypothetical protein
VTEWIRLGLDVVGMIVVAFLAWVAIKVQIAVLVTKVDFWIIAINTATIKIDKSLDQHNLMREEVSVLNQRVLNIEEDVRLLRTGKGYIK